MNERMLRVGGIIGVGLVLVLFRLVQLTIVQGDELARQAAVQHQRRLMLAPRRGEIVDRNGEILALSFPSESLFVRTKEVSPAAAKQTLALASSLRLPLQDVQKALHSSSPFVPARM